MGLTTGIILLVIGLIACFFGWRFYRIILALFGFSLGYYAVLGLLAGQEELIQIGGAVIVGLIVALLFWTYYKFAYILFGIVLGVSVAALLGEAFNLDGTIYLIAVVVLGIIGALLGGVLADLIIRLSTAFGGATQAIGGLSAILVAANISVPLADPTHGGVNTESTAGIITLIAVIILGGIGFLFQSRNAPKRR